MTQPPSILETLVNAAQQHTPANFAQRGTIRQGKSDLLVVGLDNGNDALKGAVLTEEGRLVTLRIPTAIREALIVRGGKQEVTYTIGETPSGLVTPPSITMAMGCLLARPTSALSIHACGCFSPLVWLSY